MKKGNWKKIMSILAATIGTTFVITSLVAKKEIGKSQYKDESNQMNPLEGKKVVFIENDDEIENADGVRGHLEAIGDSDYKVGFYEKYIKRGFDIVLSFGGLVVLSPILGAIALAIKIDDPGPVLFTQKRMGQNKKYFKLHKFRSMKMCTPHDVPTHQLENPEQYITRVGKFLRSHSLDELPQIWDIFIGNMSVIGPRPGLWNQDILTAERDKYNANDVKPGLTGWAQINGRDELEIPVKAKLDGEYVKHMGLIMDLKTTFPFTMGLNQFDFINYEDFCEQVAAACTQNVVNGIINICSGRPEKLADRVERFIKENGYDIKLEYGKFPDRPYDSKAVWGNSSKIEMIIRNSEC